ncbi:hypothetical protein A8C56_14430 [Niabella ginsenosidivorans]|uniref:Uncharacterized protein n=1 Tax=Niabella ginsenosidivorans TaxID=1176587 RepID=A0A1A9I2V9_9BACT|nr:hypothetical protein A8C56_14430 [Niabella ginsenosidivorans]
MSVPAGVEGNNNNADKQQGGKKDYFLSDLEIELRIIHLLFVKGAVVLLLEDKSKGIFNFYPFPVARRFIRLIPSV